MVKHIVMWKLADAQHKKENASKMKGMLEALVGVVPGLLKLEVAENWIAGGYDVILYSEFTDKAALDGYQNHPAIWSAKNLSTRSFPSVRRAITKFKRRPVAR